MLMSTYRRVLVSILMLICTGCAISLSSAYQTGTVGLGSLVQIEVSPVDDLETNAVAFWMDTQAEIKRQLEEKPVDQLTKQELSIVNNEPLTLIPRTFNQNVRGLERTVARKLNKSQMLIDNIPKSAIMSKSERQMNLVIKNFFMPFSNFRIWTFVKLFFITPPGIPLIYASEGRAGFVVFDVNLNICNQEHTILDSSKVHGASKSVLYQNITYTVSQRLAEIFGDIDHPVTVAMNNADCIKNY